MNRTKKILLPLSIVLISAAIILFVKLNPPQATRGKPSAGTQVLVEIQTISPQAYDIVLESYGVVAPRTQSDLVAQVSGQIMKVADQFRDGGFFEKGDPLVWIDDRDYTAEAQIAQANVLSAQQALLEEQAMGEQALKDWKRLGNGAQAGDLVLRKPQLESAKASLLSAQAQLQKAQLSVERSIVKAPYAGRILNTEADLGQVVSANTAIASIYSIDVIEVRLPINNSDLALIDLPKEYRNNIAVANKSKVYLHSDAVGKQNWIANLVRTEGAIDSSTQQLYVVAQIEDPYSQLHDDMVPIKIGQYVDAQLMGKRLNDAIVIPNSAIYQGSYVYIVNEGVLLRKEINIQWQNSEHAIIDQGLAVGDTLVLTPMGQVSSGTRVKILEPSSGNEQADQPLAKERRLKQ